MTENSDLFDPVDDATNDGFLSSFDNTLDREVAQQMLSEFPGVDHAHIKDALKIANDKLVNPNTSDIIKKTMLISSAHGYLAKIEQTSDIKFFVTGWTQKSNFENTEWKTHISGVILEDEGGKTHRYPTKIIYTHNKEQDLTNDTKGLKKFCQYDTFVRMTDNFELSKGKNHLDPHYVYGEDITTWNNIVEDTNMSIDDIYKTLYGIDLKLRVEGDPTVATGLSKRATWERQKGDFVDYTNKDDLKLILLLADSPPEPIGYAPFNARINCHTFVGQESVQVEINNHPQFTSFDNSKYGIVVAGAIEKNPNSKYSDYKMHAVALETIPMSKVEKLLEGQ